MSRMIIGGAVTLLLGIMVFILLAMGETPQFLRDYFGLLLGTMLAIIVGLIGYWWGIVRWYAYAALMFVSAICHQWLGLSFELSFIIPGGVVLLYGLVILTRFLGKYPKVSTEEFDASQ